MKKKISSSIPLSYNNVPSIDLHGETRDIARVLINNFIDDSYKIGYDKVVIIHGIGTGVLKKEVHKLLENDRRIEKAYIDFFNVGCTIVELKKDK